MRIVILVALTLLSAGCATAPPAGPVPVDTGIPVPGTPEAVRTPALPPIPAVDGALSLEVGYPAENALLTARDSNFIFGSTGSGNAALSINGLPITVAPNGGFLAFIPVPGDGVYRLHATRGAETATLERNVRVPAAAAPVMPGAHIVSPYPAGARAIARGSAVEIGFRAPPGGRAAVLLPDGSRVPLIEQAAAVEARSGDEFRAEITPSQGAPSLVRYAVMVPLSVPLIARDTAVARPTIGSLQPASATASTAVSDALLEFVTGTDTARMPLRLTVALLDPDRPRVGVVTPPPAAPADWTVRGRVDTGGPFHFFWPPGTRLALTGQRDGMYRVRLAGDRAAWVPVSDVRLLPDGSTPPGAAIASARFSPQPEWIDLRVPLSDRLPFQVTEEERILHLDVFGAVSRANFFQYGGLDPLLTYAEWSQPADSVFRVSIHLAQTVWGYHTWYDAGGALVLRVRRPPVIDADEPLRGLLIAVDPGHGGADRSTRGPTGLTEADANLYISLRLRDLLEAAGARVLMTRVTDMTVPLGDRPALAADSGAHVLVSVHNNAFPDGVNPWTNNGTSTYYYHPRSADLARDMQRELLQELGMRDIGYGRADLALARPTWMPAVLTETMFMMVPEQEAALRDPSVHERIARAHLRALENFLRRRMAP